MRLFTKIFLFGMLAFGLAFSVSGYFLLHFSLKSSLEREADFALKQYQYDKFMVQSAVLTYLDASIVISIVDEFSSGDGQVYTITSKLPQEQESDDLQEFWDVQGKSEEQDGVWNYYFETDQEPFSGKFFWDSPLADAEGFMTSGLSNELVQTLAEEITVPVAFLAEDKTVIYSEIEGLDLSFLDSLSEEAHMYRFRDEPSRSVLVGSILKLGEVLGNGQAAQETANTDTSEDGRRLYFITEWDISKTIEQQNTMRQYFVRCYLVAMAAGMVLLVLLSAFLTGPLKRMSRAASRMAEGDYQERFRLSGKDEIGELAVSFNQMADAVEEKIGELSKAAREKEDFVANFAHELKTPLTSIIGYADTMYQKELSREEIRKASWHIWNEGMRLESLSLKLMELTVLGRQEFPLQEMAAEEVLRDVAEGMAPLSEERQIDIHFGAEHAYVRVDYDLLKTLLLNLVDNAMQAGSTRIELQGKKEEGKYWICVKDNGCGMEEEVLSRITEAFYMVDKARSRKQHGAGLGLALADRIAGIHGSELVFESEIGVGTKVSFCMECVEDNEEEKQQS